MAGISISGAGGAGGGLSQATADNRYVAKAPAPSGDTTGATDTAALTALAVAGTKVALQAGTYYLNAALPLLNGLVWDGAGETATILQVANGANCDAFTGQNFATLTGGGTGTTATGVVGWAISNLTIDGNRANQTYGGGIVAAHATPTSAPTYGYGVRVYGRNWRLSNVTVRRCLAYGLWTEFGIPSGSYTGSDSVEARAVNVKVHENGVHGWYHRGPSDCQFVNVVCWSDNQAGLASAVEFWAEADNVTNASGTSNFSPNGLQLVDMHTWGGSAKWGIVLDCNASASNCHAEGHATGQVLLRGKTKWNGGSAYYILSQSTKTGCGVQFGDDGTAAGVPTTGSYSSNVTWNGEIDGALSDVAARAAIRWVNCAQSMVKAIVRTPSTIPNTTVAVGSNGVDVSTFAGAGTLNVVGGSGANNLPPNGTVTVATSGVTATITYTGNTGSTLTGCTTTAGTGTVSTGGAVTLANVATVAVSGTVDTASAVDIDVNGSGLTAGVTQTASRNFRKGAHRVDAGTSSTALTVRNGATSKDAVNVNTSSNRLELVNGANIRGYSDAYTTKTLELDMANGHYTAPGITGFVPTTNPQGNLGTSGTATIDANGNDARHVVTLTAGSAATAAGNQVIVTYAHSYSATSPTTYPTISPGKGSTSAQVAAFYAAQPYVSSAGQSSYTIAFVNAAPANTVILIQVAVLG